MSLFTKPNDTILTAYSKLTIDLHYASGLAVPDNTGKSNQCIGEVITPKPCRYQISLCKLRLSLVFQ